MTARHTFLLCSEAGLCDSWAALWPPPRPLVRSARAHRPDEPGTSLVLLRRAVPAQAERAAGQPVVPLADERVGDLAGDPRDAPGSRRIGGRLSVAEREPPEGVPTRPGSGDLELKSRTHAEGEDHQAE